VQTVDGGVVVRRVKTGKPQKADTKDPLFGLLARGAALAYPGAEVKLEVAHLATDSVAAIEMDAETEQAMLKKLDGALRGIRRGAFPAAPADRKDCAQCAHYFLCPKAEAA
jgi:hypothetical protein